jgi:hypothetical protein
VHTEPPQELFPGESGRLLLSIVPVIFQGKLNMLIIYADKTMIGNGHPVSILAKITHHMFRIAKGRFTVNDPWFVPCMFYLRQILRDDFLFRQTTFKPGHKYAPELQTQLHNRKKISAASSNILKSAIKGMTQCRNYAMNMRVERKVLPPGMQDAYSAGFSCKMTVSE